MEVPPIEGGDLGDAEPFGHRDDGQVGCPEREVRVGLDEISHAVVVDDLEIDHREGRSTIDRRNPASTQDTARSTEKVTDLGNDRSRHEKLTTGQVQTGEQIGAGSIVLVVPIRSGDQRPGIDDDRSGTPEPVGEQIVVVAAQVGAAAGEGAEPRRRPLRNRLKPPLPTGQLLHEASQLVTLGAHEPGIPSRTDKTVEPNRHTQ